MRETKKLQILLVLTFLAVVVYTLLVKPRRFFQCLPEPVRYVTRDFDNGQRVSLPDPEEGNRVRLLVNGNEALPALLEMIDGAQQTIEWQVMLFHPDDAGRTLAAALARAAQRGVQVRLSFNIEQTVNGTIADHYPRERKARNKREMQDMLALLAQAGVEVRENPAKVDFPLDGANARARQIQQDLQRNVCLSFNHYDHRKMLIADHQTALVGGMNVGNAYLYWYPPVVESDMVAESHQRRSQNLPEAWEKWFDTAVILEGPVVRQIIDEFNWKWEILGGKPLPVQEPLSGAGDVPVQFLSQRPGHRQISERFFDLVANAQDEIWVASPFVSYDPALDALQSASRRGVRIIFIYPYGRQEMDFSARIFRESANALIASGIDLYFNDLRMAHTKLMVVDEQQVLLGSFNLNHRSFRHDLETAVVVDDESFARQVIDRVFKPYLTISHPVLEPLAVPLNPVNWFLKPFS